MRISLILLLFIVPLFSQTYIHNLPCTDNAANTIVTNNGSSAAWVATVNTNTITAETASAFLMNADNDGAASPDSINISNIEVTITIKPQTLPSGDTRIIWQIGDGNAGTAAGEFVIVIQNQKIELRANFGGYGTTVSDTITTWSTSNYDTLVFQIDASANPWVVSVTKDGTAINMNAWSSEQDATSFGRKIHLGGGTNEPDHYIKDFKVRRMVDSYYVSDQGSDSNGGLLVTDAWLTVDYGVSTAVQPGDNILLFTGDLFREQATMDASGTSGNPITVSAVDSATGLTGSATVGAKPIINGADVIGTWVDATGGVYYSLGLSNEPKLVARNGVVGTLWATKSSGVGSDSTQFWTTSGDDTLYIYTATASDTSNIEAGRRNLCISNVDKSYITVEYLELKYANADGVWFKGHATNTVTGGIFDNLTINNTGNDGIAVGQNSGVRNPDNVIISNCTITYWGRESTTASSAIKFGTGDSGGVQYDIQNNLIYADFNIHTLGVSAVHDAITLFAGDDILIENNEVYHSGHVIVIKGDSVSKRAGNTIMRYNYLHDNSDDAIWLAGMSVSSTHDIYYNILDGDSSDNVLDIQGGTVNVYNNMMKNSYEDMLVVSLYPATVNVKNNIFYNWGNISGHARYAIKFVTAGVHETIGSSIFDNNIYYSPANTLQANFPNGYGALETFAEWQDSTSQDANSLTSDPLFTDATGLDFTLQTKSPAIDAGASVGLVLDYTGLIVPAPVNRRLVDIGAYEYRLSLGYENRFPVRSDFPKFPRR